MKLRRRTKKAYMELFDNREHLFEGVETLLWPNGEPEIWFKTGDGLGFRLRVSNGPAGLGITINRFAGGVPVTVTGNMPPDDEIAPQRDQTEVSICQYRSDARSQAFKRWYGSEGTEPHPDAVRLYLATGNGWEHFDCSSVEIAHARLRRSEFTHWAISPIERCDARITPPPSVQIHEKKTLSQRTQERKK